MDGLKWLDEYREGEDAREQPVNPYGAGQKPAASAQAAPSAYIPPPPDLSGVPNPTLDVQRDKIDDVVIVAVLLLHRPGGITNGEAILDGMVVKGRKFSVMNLRSRLSDLRKILGDSADCPRLIMWQQEETMKGKCKRYFLSVDGRRAIKDWLLTSAGGHPQHGVML